MPDEAVAPEVSVEELPVPDIVPLLEVLDPEPIVPVLLPVVPVLLVPVSVEDGVLPLDPLRVSSVVEVVEEPVVLPLL